MVEKQLKNVVEVRIVELEYKLMNAIEMKMSNSQLKPVYYTQSYWICNPHLWVVEILLFISYSRRWKFFHAFHCDAGPFRALVETERAAIALFSIDYWPPFFVQLNRLITRILAY